MNLRLLLALCPLLGLGAPLYAQSLCEDCFYAAEEEARKCLESVTGPSERNTCLDNRQTQMKACSDNQCKEDREESAITETQPTAGQPGLAPYMPSEGEWLALIMRVGLRREATPDRPYSLDIVLADPQTLQIILRHASTMDKDQLNKAIEAARDMIRSTAKGYGWDRWVKIREKVEMYPAKK